MSEGLIVVDVQNDFTPGGALAVPAGDEVIGRINELMGSGRFDLVLATRDWHPPDHGSFATNDPPGPWPVHCVQGTPGAELHPALRREDIDRIVDKGQDPATEGYSGFDATGLGDLLRERGVDAVTVVGLATDYCVKNTALDALREGFAVTVVGTATRPVDVQPGDGDRALAEMRAAGARVT
jgi:nicotinamidase/pyrazinamidase